MELEAVPITVEAWEGSTGEESGVKLEAPGMPETLLFVGGGFIVGRKYSETTSSLALCSFGLVTFGNVNVHFDGLTFLESEVELRLGLQIFLQRKNQINKQNMVLYFTFDICSSFLTPWK